MFTDRSINALKPRKNAYRIFEKGPIPGFCLSVTPNGVKTFRLQYTIAGRQRFLKLGRYPAISLQEARERAQAAREEVERGNDPGVTAAPGSDHQVKRTGTVQDALDLYIEDMKARGKTSWTYVEHNLGLHVIPTLGTRLARDIRPEHVQGILAQVMKRGVRMQHNAVRRHLHAVFQHALHYDYDPRATLRKVRFGLTSNPVAAVPHDRGAEAARKDRNLSFEEIRAVWNYTGWHHVPHTALKLILALGGLRPVEVLGAMWDEFNLPAMTFTIPPERFKLRRYHVVPIGSLAYGLLAKPIVEGVKSPFLFPTLSPKSKSPYYSVNSLSQYFGRCWDAEERNWPEGVDRFTPYDIRRTFKTRTGEMGMAKEIRDRIQGHALSDVSSRHYDRWDYLPQKREAMDAWDARLREVIAAAE